MGPPLICILCKEVLILDSEGPESPHLITMCFSHHASVTVVLRVQELDDGFQG